MPDVGLQDDTLLAMVVNAVHALRGVAPAVLAAACTPPTQTQVGDAVVAQRGAPAGGNAGPVVRVTVDQMVGADVLRRWAVGEAPRP